MAHFVNLITCEPDVSRVPLCIDSSDFKVCSNCIIYSKPDFLVLKQSMLIRLRVRRSIEKFKYKFALLNIFIRVAPYDLAFISFVLSESPPRGRLTKRCEF